MNYLIKYYNNIVRYDLSNKFNYKNINKIPKIKTIILNFGCKTSDLKKLSLSFLALQLISKTRGKLSLTRKSNIFFKIRKGQPVGCQIIIKKKKMFRIILYLYKIMLNTKYDLIFRHDFYKSITLNISNLFNFNIIENNYFLFSNINNINITIIFDNNTNNEILFILNSLKIINEEKHK